MKSILLFLFLFIAYSQASIIKSNAVDDIISELEGLTDVDGDLDEQWNLIEGDLDKETIALFNSGNLSIKTILKALLKLKELIGQQLDIKGCIEKAIGDFKDSIINFIQAIKNLFDLLKNKKGRDNECAAIGGDKPNILQILQRAWCRNRVNLEFVKKIVVAVVEVAKAYLKIVPIQDSIKNCIPIVG